MLQAQPPLKGRLTAPKTKKTHALFEGNPSRSSSLKATSTVYVKSGIV